MHIFGKEALLIVLACAALGSSPVRAAHQEDPPQAAAEQIEDCGEDQECVKECGEDKECIKERKQRQSAAGSSSSSSAADGKNRQAGKKGAESRAQGTSAGKTNQSAHAAGTSGGQRAAGTSGGTTRQAAGSGTGGGAERERLMGAGGVKAKSKGAATNQPKTEDNGGPKNEPKTEDNGGPKNEPKAAAKIGQPCSTNDAGSVRMDEAQRHLVVCLKTQGEEGDAFSWQAVAGKRVYSATCEDWAESGFSSKEACVTDGRWHLVYQNDEDGNTIGGSIHDLKRHAANGADIRNADAGGVHNCQTVGWPSDDECMVVCFDGARVSGNEKIFAASVTTNDGSIGLGAAARRCDGKRILSNVLPKSTDGTPKSEGLMRDGSAAFNWFVKY